MRLFMSLVENAVTPAERWINACDGMAEFKNKVFVSFSEINDTTAEIDDISAADMGQGWGSKALAAFCAKADELGVTIILGVANETDGFDPDDEFPDEDDLIRWYSRFGFETYQASLMDERTRMKRTPV